jgi:hypothetical protein
MKVIHTGDRSYAWGTNIRRAALPLTGLIYSRVHRHFINSQGFALNVTFYGAYRIEI